MIEIKKDDREGAAGVLTRDIDRRGFLKCMQWAGAGVVWSFAGGVPASRLLGAQPAKTRSEDFAFVQISDSHIGFDKAANPDVNATFQAAVDKINALDRQPDFILHTGDLSHLAKASEFDTLDQLLRGLRQKQIFFVPGEHDLLGDDGKQYLERFGKGTMGRGWQSFDHKGVHFIGLNNSAQLEGMGALGDAADGVAQERCGQAGGQHSDCGLRSYSAVGRISGVGLGHQGQRASPRPAEAVRLRDRAQRAHSSSDAEGGRKCDVPFRDVDGISATRAGKRACRLDL